jgi:4-hydroxy-tetrahydrodipicolinate synthase
MILPPMRYKHNDYETITHFKAIANSTDLPITFHTIIPDYGIEVTLDMFEEMLECKKY